MDVAKAGPAYRAKLVDENARTAKLIAEKLFGYKAMFGNAMLKAIEPNAPSLGRRSTCTARTIQISGRGPDASSWQ